MKLTVIGAGNMGGALIKGWVKALRAGKTDLEITITAHSQQTLDRFTTNYPELKTTLNNTEAITGADVVILAVKPWLIEPVISEIHPQLKLGQPIVISVAANVLTPKLQELTGSDRVVYAMPNIGAEFGESMTFVAKSPNIEAEKCAEQLMQLVGSVQVVEERLVAAGMMMAGCGIAYVMRFVRAMMEGGVEMGFYPNVAKEIALQTMKGATTLLSETGLHPEAAIDKVTTPGGVTIKGLNELDHSGFNSAVIRCLKAGLK